jgi:hypothetical protein
LVALQSTGHEIPMTKFGTRTSYSTCKSYSTQYAQELQYMQDVQYAVRARCTVRSTGNKFRVYCCAYSRPTASPNYGYAASVPAIQHPYQQPSSRCMRVIR